MQTKHWEEKMLEQAIDYKKNIINHLFQQKGSYRSIQAIGRHEWELLILQARLELMDSQPNA